MTALFACAAAMGQAVIDGTTVTNVNSEDYTWDQGVFSVSILNGGKILNSVDSGGYNFVNGITDYKADSTTLTMSNGAEIDVTATSDASGASVEADGLTTGGINATIYDSSIKAAANAEDTIYMAATSALLGYNGDCVIDAKNATFTTSTNNNGSGKIAYSAGVGVSEGRINATFTGSQIVSTATAANGFAQSAGIYTSPYVTDSQTPKNGDISVSLDSSKIQVKSEGVDNSNSLMTLPSGAYGIVGELATLLWICRTIPKLTPNRTPWRPEFTPKAAR